MRMLEKYKLKKLNLIQIANQQYYIAIYICFHSPSRIILYHSHETTLILIDNYLTINTETELIVLISRLL